MPRLAWPVPRPRRGAGPDDRHHGDPQGRHVPPSGRVPPGDGHGLPRAPGCGVGLPVDPADVPHQRLVLPLGGLTGRRRPPLSASRRSGGDLAGVQRRRGDPPRRGPHRPRLDRDAPATPAEHPAFDPRLHRRCATDAVVARAHRGDRDRRHPPLRAHGDLRSRRHLRVAQRVGRTPCRPSREPQGEAGRPQHRVATPPGDRRRRRRRPRGRRHSRRDRPTRQQRHARLLP